MNKIKINSNKKIKCVSCRNYEIANRTFGNCTKLNITVRGSWQACHLYLDPFSIKENLM